MKRHVESLSAAYFEERYALNPDPWRFATSDYEAAKYAATREALPKGRYDAALEVGCSIGVLTESMASRCDALLALDLAEAALRQARSRCARLSNVTFLRARVPAEWPSGAFDLILLSEVVYYLDAADVIRLVGRVRDSLTPGGDVLMAHWTGETHYPLTGDEAARLFISEAASFLRPTHQGGTEAYRLDVLTSTVPRAPSTIPR